MRVLGTVEETEQGGAAERTPVIRATKRSLFAVSRSIEQLAMSLAPVAGDVILVGLFQQAAYHEPSRWLYDVLARKLDVVVAYAGEAVGQGHVPTLTIPADDPLAEEWTVVLASQRVSAALVARDLGAIGSGRTADDARLFDSTVGTDPVWVRGQLDRLAGAASGLHASETCRSLLRSAATVAGVGRDRIDDAAHQTWLREWTGSIRRLNDLQDLERLSFTDPLTGAQNRRYLEQFLSGGGPNTPSIAVIAFDLDDFKTLNDLYGHAVGDEALRVFADGARGAVRGADVLVRLGGDEFLLLLPGAGIDRAEECAHEVIVAARNASLSVSGATISASAGVGVFPSRRVDLAAVDHALYAAKRAGVAVARVAGTAGSVIETP